MFKRAISVIIRILLVMGLLTLAFNFGDFRQQFASYAHTGDELSGWAYVVPTIDGVIDATEWSFAASVAYTTTGGTGGVFYVMNDAVNLYSAVVTTDPTLSMGGAGVDAVMLYFDNDHDGVGPESGDEILGWEGYLGEGFRDGFSDGTYVWRRDSDFGGTSDGAAAATNNGTHNHFEIVHPLSTLDPLHDFRLWMSNSPKIGFALRLTVDGFDKGWWPSLDPAGWRDIAIYTPKLSAWATTTPLIDGVLRPAVDVLGLRPEWENACKMEFTLSWTRPLQLTEYHRATVYVMNDYINLYLAFEIHGEDLSGSDKLLFNFDNDNDGLKDSGDDHLFVEGINFFHDGFFAGLPQHDVDWHGTLDGVGASSYVAKPNTMNVSYGFEIAHPLNTSDDGFDFSLTIGDTVGFNVLFLEDGDPLYGDGWPTFTQEDWSQMADIVIAGPPEPPPGPSINLKIRKIEITQAIQWLDDTEHEDNSVSLVRGKSTVVRVYVDASGYATWIRGVSVYLYATDGASAVSLVEPGLWSSAGPLDETFDTPSRLHMDRGNEAHTANFLLPPYWVDRSSLTLVAFVKTHDSQVETDYTDNWMNRQTFSFTPTVPLKIGYIRIDYRPTAPDEDPNLPSDLILTGYKFFEKATPMPDLSDQIIYYEIAPPRLNWTESFFYLNRTDGTREFNKTSAGNLLKELRDDYFLGLPEAERPDQICAWYPITNPLNLQANITGCAGGGFWRDEETWIQVASLNCESRPWGFAHEIGHNCGFGHSWEDPDNPWINMTRARADSCQTYGYDTQGIWFGAGPDYREPGDIVKMPLNVTAEGKYGALMSYKDQYRWISPWEWEILKVNFTNPPWRALLHTLPNEAQSSSQSLQVSGVIYRKGTASLDPVFQLQSFENLTGPSGPYIVQLRGAPPAEPILYSQSFDVSFESTVEEDPSPLDRAHFILNLPFVTGAYSVSLWNTSISPSILLDKITASPNPPSVTITYPNGDQTVGDLFDVTWTASDLDGDPLTFKLFYSNDNGTTWKPLSPRLTKTSYRVDTSMLPGGSQWLIRVQVSDGFYTSEDQSDGMFTVPSKNPQDLLAYFQSRVPNESYLNSSSERQSVRSHGGTFTILKGSAFDPEDGWLTGTALTWTSDINGTLGTGSVLTVIDLIPGIHNITLTATDSDGNNATKSFTLRVVLSDTAVTDVSVTKTVVGQGHTLDINAEVENRGNSPATFNITIQVNDTEIETQEVTLTSGNSTRITFTWNTTGFAKGNYTIIAYAWPDLGETNAADNILSDGWVFVSIVGDVNGDRKVDIQDVARVSGAFASIRVNNPHDPRHAQYWHQTPCKYCPHDPNADINNDGVCDIQDLARTSANYGKWW